MQVGLAEHDHANQQNPQHGRAAEPSSPGTYLRNAVSSSPLKERVFKVLKSAVEPDNSNFVSLDELQ